MARAEDSKSDTAKVDQNTVNEESLPNTEAGSHPVAHAVFAIVALVAIVFVFRDLGTASLDPSLASFFGLSLGWILTRPPSGVKNNEKAKQSQSCL